MLSKEKQTAYGHCETVSSYEHIAQLLNLRVFTIEVKYTPVLSLPGYGAATNPVLSVGERSIDPGSSGDRSVIGIVLDVHA